MTSLTDLTRTIRSEECGIKTIDHLLELLPEKMRSQFVLVYKSQSLQGPHHTDYQNPRAILYNQSAQASSGSLTTEKKSLYLSFNGLPSQPNFLHLEILELDEAALKPSETLFRYFDIEFPDRESSQSLSWIDAQKLIKISDPNPIQCRGCHGNGKPVFHTYPQWEGVYGSFHGSVDTNEKMELEKFATKAHEDTNSRYHHLLFESNLKNRAATLESILNGERNTYFNISLSEPNFLRVARKIQKNPLYNAFRYAIVGAALDCAHFEAFIPPSLRNSLDTNLDSLWSLNQKYSEATIDSILNRFYDLGVNQFGMIISMTHHHDSSVPEPLTREDFLRVQRHYWGEWSILNKLWIDTMNRQGPHRTDPGVAKLRYLLEGQGMTMQDWFLELKKRTYRWSDGFQWSEGLAWTLLAEDEDFKSYAELAQKANEATAFYRDEIFDYKNRDDYKRKLCGQLQSKSSQALQSIEIPRIGSTVTFGVAENIKQISVIKSRPRR